MNKIVVVDVETANCDISSICQIGIAVFNYDGILEEKFVSLVNPQTSFDFFNTSIHGIDEDSVKDSPTIQQLEPTIRHYLSLGLVASHSLFDKTALNEAIGNIDMRWLDTTRVVRRTWSDLAYSGYGLKNVCKFLGIKFINHHDALEDAIKAGEVLFEAVKYSNSDIEQIFDSAYKPLSIKPPLKQLSNPNPQGEYFGEILVFTGTLSISRKEAILRANLKGFDVSNTVNKHTNYLVKGLADISKFRGKEMSSKETKALKLIRENHDIIFLSEQDFFKLIN